MIVEDVSNYNGPNISCNNYNDGFIELTTTGGYLPYNYNWSGPNNFLSNDEDINALSNLGTPYSGILYSGLILTENGPKVLEFNCRFGDPEAQTILPLLKTDLADLILKISDNKLNDINVQWADKNSVSIVLASGGYPEKYVTGYTIDGIEEISDSVLIFHAGTDIIPSSKLLVTNGGRVLTLTSLGNNLNDARNKVYLNLSNNILFENMFYRKDIAI